MLYKAYYLAIWMLLPTIENRIHAFVLCTRNTYNACVSRYSIAGSSCETQLNNVFYCVNAVFSITYNFDILSFVQRILIQYHMTYIYQYVTTAQLCFFSISNHSQSWNYPLDFLGKYNSLIYTGTLGINRL